MDHLATFILANSTCRRQSFFGGHNIQPSCERFSAVDAGQASSIPRLLIESVANMITRARSRTLRKVQHLP